LFTYPKFVVDAQLPTPCRKQSSSRIKNRGLIKYILRTENASLNLSKQKLAATPRITQEEMEVQLEVKRQQLEAQRDEEMKEMEDA